MDNCHFGEKQVKILKITLAGNEEFDTSLQEVLYIIAACANFIVVFVLEANPGVEYRNRLTPKYDIIRMAAAI